MTRLRPLFLVAAGFLCAAGLHAQTSAIAPRIVQSIDDSNLVTLKGNVTALARSQFDRGEADPAMQMTSVRMVLSRSQEQEAALEQFMAQQLDKSSPNYHHWLTPQQFGKLYGPADSDIAAIVAWLESRGLTVEPVPPGRTNIAFSGSVSQIEQAFHTAIHSFNANGREFYSNIGNPHIPAALAPVVSGVAHLNTLEPQSHAIRGPDGKYDADLKRFVTANPDAIEAHPELTTGSSGSQTLYVVAGDAATIYDTPNSLNANFSSGTSYTGTGVTIGIGGEALIQSTTVDSYEALFDGGAPPMVTNVIPDANYSATAGALDEAYLDTEISGAFAPGATIHFYVSQILQNAIQQAINDNSVDIFSLSFGECELDLTTADNQAINGWWQQAAAQGIVVTVSSGDSGSAGCDNQNTAQTAANGLQVSGFASTPYNIAVGGTDYHGLLSGFSNYVSATNGTMYRSALKYIPESTWNDSVQSDGLLASNVAAVGVLKTGQTNIVAGSGGVSACSANTTTTTGTTITPGNCTSGYARPSWQRGPGLPSGSNRVLPDVSVLAGNGYDGATWLVCTDDTFTQSGTTYTTNCNNQGSGFAFVGVGGTSASAPAFAGILALVQQKLGGGRMGIEAAKVLYDLYNGPQASSVFHDVTQGNISVPCTSGTPNCAQNTAGNYFLTGYDTAAGYDLATGLGSVDVSQLLNFWSGSIGSKSATLAISTPGTPTAVTVPYDVDVTVTGSGNPSPTGTVILSSGKYSSPPEMIPSSGLVSFIIPAGTLQEGTNTLTATYAGDWSYASTTATVNVTLQKATPSMTVTPSANTISPNQSLTVSVTVAGWGNLGTPTGTVTLSGGSYNSAATALSGGTASFTIPAGTLPSGWTILTATYSGDGNYASNFARANVQVGLTPTVTITPAATSIDSSQSLSLSVKVTGTGAAPTGTVTVTGGGYTGSPTKISSGTASITIPANSVAAGTVTLTATYSGDANYGGGTATVQITVTQSSFTVSTGTPPSAINPGGTATETITIGTSSSYSGTVTLACAAASNNPANQSGDAPTCTVNPSPVTLGGTNGNSVTATVTIGTTAASAQMQKPPIGDWMAGGGTALALLVFFGIPARRRRWRTLLGMIALLIAFGGFSACGGGGSSSSNTNSSNPGTTAGAYTFTITGTGSPAITPAPSASINLTIN